MKHLLSITFFILCLVSCKKDNMSVSSNTYIEQVKKGLKDSVAPLDYAILDFNEARLAAVDSVNLYLVRIPFKQKDIANDFVLLQTNMEGAINRGKIVHMERSLVAYGMGKPKAYSYQGSITIQSLNRATALHSLISDGYIEAFHPESNFRTAVKQPDNMLPEVVVVGYYDSGGVSYSDWISLLSFFKDSESGNCGYYSPVSLGSGDGNINSGGSSPKGDEDSEQTETSKGGGIKQEAPILIDVETQGDNPAIDIEKYLACFGNIPDAGSTSSITIYADIPVDSDPRKLFDIGTMAPGHTFIEITKTNGTQRVSQKIGFYPKTRIKPALTDAPVEGKFVDNEGHEFNASFKMNLSADNLQRVLNEIRYLARFIKYDIDEYNCTDFALDIFNAARTNKLLIPLYDIPGGITAAGSRTPNGLFIKLNEMVAANDPEAGNITTNIIKGWAGSSKGPCN